jgi:hypothetical protein
MDLPAPWDVQCDSINNIKEAASFDKVDKSSQAHFQLAVAYRIGYGLEPNASKAQDHLQSMILQDCAQKVHFERIATSIEQERLDKTLSDKEPSLLQENSTGQYSGREFSVFFRRFCGSDYKSMTDGLQTSLSDIIFEAQEYSLDGRPSLFHWLILLSPSKAREILDYHRSRYNTWRVYEFKVREPEVSVSNIVSTKHRLCRC